MENNKMVLNAHFGSSNVVSAEDINTIMFSVINDIGSILEEHCGPYSNFAMIAPGANNPLGAPIFTKDGINIINATEYTNPIEKQTKDLMSHIGSKVEAAAGDGTTSSMYLANKIILMLREYLKDNPFINYNQFKEAYEMFVTDVSESLKDMAIIPDIKDKALIGGIAYSQAMSSSHGDIELSEMVSELMSSLPRQAWDYQIFVREVRESGKRFRIIMDESSYSTQCYIADNKMYNNSTGIEMKVEGAELCLVPGELISNGMEFELVKAKIEALTLESPHLTIISAFNADMMVTNTILELFQSKRKEGINFSWFKIMLNHQNINDLTALFATTGKYMHKCVGEIFCFDNIDLEYKDDILYIHNLVEYAEDGEHPDIGTPGSTINTYIYVLEDYIESAKNHKNVNPAIVTLSKRILNCIKCEIVGYISIGGTAYDNSASAEVLTDVLSATRESLTKGVVLGGYKALSKATKTINIDSESEVVVPKKDYLVVSTTEINGDVKIIFNHAIRMLLELLYVDKCPHTEDVSGKHTTQSLVEDNDMSFDVISGTALRMDEDTMRSSKRNDFLVTQPITTDLEFIKRFGEVAIKFLFTHRVLIPDTVSVKESLLK